MLTYIIIFLITCISLLVLLIFNTRLKTNKLYEKNLKHGEELKQSEEVKDQIFRVVSHDMRASVNALISFNQLLEYDDIPPEKLAVYTDELKNILNQNSVLMDNLFNWGTSQMGDFIQDTERFDISVKVNEVIGSLYVRAADKKIIIKNNISPGTLVSADINMTDLILRNLLGNAIKYTSDKGMIELYSEYTDNNVSVSVKDNGTGMPEKLVQQFNTGSHLQFVKSSQGTNNEKGTGLGLILCKNFAQLMKGSISVKSEVDKGSIFSLVLPV